MLTKDAARRLAANFAKLQELLTRRVVAAGLLVRSALGISRFDFARTTTNIAAVSASSAAFFAVAE